MVRSDRQDAQWININTSDRNWFMIYIYIYLLYCEITNIQVYII